MQIATLNQVQTMSTREIAELTGKEHKNVIRDAKKMLVELEKDTLNFERIYFDTMNRQKSELLLPKDECLCLVSGYNVKLRMAIIKRWDELEKQTPKLPETKLEWIELCLEQEKKALALEAKVQEDAPKVQFHDSVVNFSETLGLRESGKHLGKYPNKFIEWLRDNKYLRHNNEPYQCYINQGLFKVSIGLTDSERPFRQTRVTMKGLAYFASKTFGLDI